MANELLERLYKVFSRYARPTQLPGCPCCTSPEEALPLLRTPLRTIPAHALEHYSFKAITTWGTLADYKYYLPRILELTAEDSPPCDVEVTLGKCTYRDFYTWPSDEQQAIQDFVSAAWREYTLRHRLTDADRLLCGAARLLADVSPMLEWADANAPHVRPEYAAEHGNAAKRKLLNSYWDKHSQNYQRVLSWLYPDSLKAP